MSDFHEDLDLTVQLSLPHSCSHGWTWRFLKAFATVSPWVRKHTKWEFQGLVAKTYIKIGTEHLATHRHENEFTVMDWNFAQGESHQCLLVSLRISLESKKDHEKGVSTAYVSWQFSQTMPCQIISKQSSGQMKPTGHVLWQTDGANVCTHTNTAGLNTGFNIVQPAFYMLGLVSAQ